MERIQQHGNWDLSRVAHAEQSPSATPDHFFRRSERSRGIPFAIILQARQNHLSASLLPQQAAEHAEIGAVAVIHCIELAAGVVVADINEHQLRDISVCCDQSCLGTCPSLGNLAMPRR